MKRRTFVHDGLRLSYLDDDNDGRPLIALHAHWMEGATYAPLAAALAPDWRVIALDQRGHGYSDHAPRPAGYSRETYLGDLLALFAHLDIASAVLLGNSLGGVNAYQLAARHPDRVDAMVVEDIEAVVNADATFVLDWEGLFPSREALADRVGPRFLPYLEDSFRQTPAGWRLAFEPRDIVASQAQLNGDHWTDWLASTCPALVIRGEASRLTTPKAMTEMVERRPGTEGITLPGGHVVHADDPTGFVAAVRRFLERV